MKRRMRGVSLAELLIAISSVGLLAAVVIPIYQNYTRRMYFHEVMTIVAPYKNAVKECAHNLKTLNGCNAGTYNIPLAIASPKGAVASLDVENGIISVQPVALHGITNQDSFELTPTFVAGQIVAWIGSGRAVLMGYIQ